MKRRVGLQAERKMMATVAAKMVTMGLAAMLLTAATGRGAVAVHPLVGSGEGLKPLATHVGGRVERTDDGYVRQWPGSYFETAFRGGSVVFRVGSGEVKLNLLVDGRTVDTLVRPAPGPYRIDGLAAGRHVLRVEVASESQAAPTVFGGFAAPGGTVAAPLRPRSRQIEFIGDSHTVDYANTSSKTDCTQDEVWASTDASRGFGPLLAKRYDADYQINAISGRGVVRNYNGFAAPSLPEAYRSVLFDGRTPAGMRDWHPQVIVIALGTNDFTTPLRAGERWPTRDALHADYEATYVALVRELRRRHPRAFIVLWATGMAGGEIEAEVGKVAASLRAAGERRLAFVQIDDLSFTACHAHPSEADDRRIADRIDAVLRASPDVWKGVTRAQR